MLSYFSNSLSPSIWKNIYLLSLSLSLFLSLKVLTYPLILGNIKTNGLLTSSKHAIKCLRLFCILINFEMDILLRSTS